MWLQFYIHSQTIISQSASKWYLIVYLHWQQSWVWPHICAPPVVPLGQLCWACPRLFLHQATISGAEGAIPDLEGLHCFPHFRGLVCPHLVLPALVFVRDELIIVHKLMFRQPLCKTLLLLQGQTGRLLDPLCLLCGGPASGGSPPDCGTVLAGLPDLEEGGGDGTTGWCGLADPRPLLRPLWTFFGMVIKR